MAPDLNIQAIPLSEVPKGSMVDAKATQPVVLVVDDERAIADTLAVILSRSGFTALTAYDGESALELARTVPPELLLSDVMMGPGMNGIQLAQALVKEVPDCKVLLFSGHAATRDLLDQAQTEGHKFTVLSKPLHPADLLARINQSLVRPRLSLVR
jgi:DNA-binding response OmpR family regulator